MDVNMPVMAGLEATRPIREPGDKVRNRQIPIVAGTANAMTGDREICLVAAMNGYVFGAARVAHTIKGAAGNVRGHALRAAAFAMEQAKYTGGRAAARAHLGELETQMSALFIELTGHLASKA